MTLGLLVALYVDLPPSSLIIGTLITLFLLQLILARMLRSSSPR
jgi:uncharacterized protein YqgC (DUF456 family)